MDSARCPVPVCGRPVAVDAGADRAYPMHNTLVGHDSAGFRFRACPAHEPELMTGLGDAIAWAVITRSGPPRTAPS
ncbi:hypothetical protein [Glycomyces salinus]|uniref:hypothetical protein n=1 Tax=Glycomyces salinus TaxID=980294 RepID=UPI0018EA3696|nr:hypothetical protein [Glycomyces salinus]